MPRMAPCADCAKPIQIGPTSLPPGEATCRDCRRASPGAGGRHGTDRRYRNGCRCDVCRQAKNARAREYRAKRNAAGRPLGRANPSKPIWRDRECARCGKRFVTQTKTTRFCSQGCAQRARHADRAALVHVPDAPAFQWLPAQHPVMRKPRKRTDWWQIVVHGPCGWCGENFTSVSTTGADRYCGRRCLSAAGKARRGRFVISPIARLAIYERDAWTCQLCLEPVDRDLMSTDPYGDWAPSLDHIVPQSRGGSHDPGNLRLAHRWCNAVRGDETYYTEADLQAA